ncbi:LOW QUALITY PROTEIN: hypothetical protein HID58_006299, partial [Brassica napus]
MTRDMSGSVANDPFKAYQEATKVMSLKKRSSSRTVSGDEVKITVAGVRGGEAGAVLVSLGKEAQSGGMTTRSVQQSTDIARSTGSLATALSNLNLKVFSQDGTVLPIEDPTEVVQVLQGGLLRLDDAKEDLLQKAYLGINRSLPGEDDFESKGYTRRIIPRTYAFQKNVPLNLQILGEHAQDPPDSMRAQRKSAWKLLLASNKNSKRSTPRHQESTRHQDKHAERPTYQKSRYNPETRQEATLLTSTPQRANQYAKRNKETGMGPSRNFGPGLNSTSRPPDPYLAKILPLRIRSVANDPFKAYQEATKVMSLKKRSSSRTVSGDEVKITAGVRGGEAGAVLVSLGKEAQKRWYDDSQSTDIARSTGSLATAFVLPRWDCPSYRGSHGGGTGSSRRASSVAKNQWQSSTSNPPSLVGVEITARLKQKLQEIYSGTKNQLGIKTNMLNVPPTKVKARSYNYNINTSKSIKYAKRNKETGMETLPKAQARPVESSMRIFSFGLRVLFNLFVLLILSLAKILPLRIPGAMPELRPSIATEPHKHLGYDQKHHPLCRRSRLLHQTFGQPRPILTMGATSHLYKAEEESLTSHPNQRSYISNQDANPFTPSA